MLESSLVYQELKKKGNNNMISNLTLIIDTREKQISHILRYAKENNINYIFKKLDYGDYSFSIKGKRSYEKEFVIERKGSLEELAGNLVGGKKNNNINKRQRFKNEFLRAKEDNAKIILLIERPGGYKAILDHDYQTQLHPNAFIGSLNSWMKKELITNIYFGKKINTCKFMIEKFTEHLAKKINC